MTPTQVKAVQSSFAQVAPEADTAAQAFYARLFEVAPQVRPLFPDDMGPQGAKLMAMLGAVVEGLDDLPALVPAAEDLARRHVDYGVVPEHYGSVGAALLDTLESALGEGFTAEVRDAWALAYGTLSGVMIAAAYPSEGATA